MSRDVLKAIFLIFVRFPEKRTLASIRPNPSEALVEIFPLRVDFKVHAFA